VEEGNACEVTAQSIAKQEKFNNMGKPKPDGGTVDGYILGLVALVGIGGYLLSRRGVRAREMKKRMEAERQRAEAIAREQKINKILSDLINELGEKFDNYPEADLREVAKKLVDADQRTYKEFIKNMDRIIDK
jgi:hypothetical protein